MSPLAAKVGMLHRTWAERARPAILEVVGATAGKRMKISACTRAEQDRAVDRVTLPLFKQWPSELHSTMIIVNWLKASVRELAELGYNVSASASESLLGYEPHMRRLRSGLLVR
jgi:hypothetical protein